jgi:DNA primase catalytic subunit
MESLATEIRSFYSLKELRENVEETIRQYKTLVADYSEWLGTLLRSMETSENKEWTKKISEMQKLLKAKTKVQKQTKKKKKGETSILEWVQFKDIMLCTDERGETEVLFEVIEELNAKLDRLEKVRESIEQLEKYGLGRNIVYLTYIREGIPEKIVFRPKKGAELEKFRFVTEFSIPIIVRK